MKDRYEFEPSEMDVRSALTIAADTARLENMPGTADRLAATRLHMENARAWAAANCPEGHRVACKLVYEFEPHVRSNFDLTRRNPYEKEES